jgi:Glycosyl transferase family 2
LNPSRRYLLISPCRDEAQYLRRTLDSVAAQSVRPALWVIVDDGSTDATCASWTWIWTCRPATSSEVDTLLDLMLRFDEAHGRRVKHNIKAGISVSQHGASRSRRTDECYRKALLRCARDKVGCQITCL